MKSRKVVILITLIVLNLTIYIHAKNSSPCRVKATTPLPYRSILDIKHGGSTRTIDSELSDGDDDESTEVKDPNYESEVEEDPESLKRRKKLQKYLLEQQILMQLRSTFLSEALAKRGLPMTTLIDVSTPEGSKPPEIVDWDCAMSTGEEPKVCFQLIYFTLKSLDHFLHLIVYPLACFRRVSIPLMRSPIQRLLRLLGQRNGFPCRHSID
jgi:hypothetical protein